MLLLLLGVLAPEAMAQRKGKKKKAKEEAKTEAPAPKINSGTFSAFKFRSVGPALTEGRISDLVVHPDNPAVWYVAVASGGVWMTKNAGTTWKPVFDSQGSYSIGCITMDPNNPLVLWVGTGENNSQRSVAYGDGIYKSIDGGATWKNMGLKQSEHISKIVVDPRDSNTIIVASQGPLWADGGERGIYRSTDGGQTWEQTLAVSDKTGANDLVFDPRNPDIMYTAAYQRRRHVWTLINGGPESNIYKSVDGGKTWKKSGRGLPGGDKGRIGLAIAPSQPDTLYAIVELPNDKGGLYRSTNAGASWQRQSGYVSGSPQYYQEIIVHPHKPDVVYSNDTYLMRSTDGGKNFSRVGNAARHVDDHVTWIDPDHEGHLLVGGDGGLYESWDNGVNWMFRGNLPIIQFYKVSTDNAEPFYNIFGGTQDNYSLAGPSRTLNRHGIRNYDWYVTHGGDGFETQVDPKDPNIIYAQSQYGVLVRYDKRSGEEIYIQPQPGKDEYIVWNWDSPLLISPHNNKRLYFAGNKLFRSDDQGNSWTAVSPDLSRQLDRNTLPVMGRVWGVDTVAKNRSTSQYGNIVGLSESPLQEGLLAVGTDDGLIQISEDGGANWRKVDGIEGIDSKAYAGWVSWSNHDVNVLYAAFNNHKMGDFKPYLLRSEDKGATWTMISSNLPERGSVYCMVEDHVDKNLLFAGTEFGVFVSIDRGQVWSRLRSGVPTIAVRDIEIQKRENDLVLGTFGRSFYVLDDYSPLRGLTEEKIEKESHLFPVRDAWAYVPSSPLGGGKRGFQGGNLYVADNPPFGAVITFYLHEGDTTLKSKRKKEEGKKAKKGEDTPYPSWDELRAEAREKSPAVVLTISDADGRVVRRLRAGNRKGFQRVAWDLTESLGMARGGRRGGGGAPTGPDGGVMVAPGTYTVTASRLVDGKMTQFGEPQSILVKDMGLNQFAPKDHTESIAFRKRAMELWKAMNALGGIIRDANSTMRGMENMILATPAADDSHLQKLYALQNRMADLEMIVNGDTIVSGRSEPTPPGLRSRMFSILRVINGTTASPTQTAKDTLDLINGEYNNFESALKKLVDEDLKALADELIAAGAAPPSGSWPNYKPSDQ